LGCGQEDIAGGSCICAGGAEGGEFISLMQQLGRNRLRKPDIVGTSLSEKLVDGIFGDGGSGGCRSCGGSVGQCQVFSFCRRLVVMNWMWREVPGCIRNNQGNPAKSPVLFARGFWARC
jgi:hypothetical protein